MRSRLLRQRAAQALAVFVTSMVVPHVHAFVGHDGAARDHRAHEVGRATQTQHAHVLLGSTHLLYFLLDDGEQVWGYNPASLEGEGGRVAVPVTIDISGGDAEDVDAASAVDAAINAIDGWSSTRTDERLDIAGPGDVTWGRGWDEATHGEASGSHHSRITPGQGTYGQGPANAPYLLQWVAPATLPVVMLRWVVGSVNVGTGYRWALWTDDGGAPGDLVADFGRFAGTLTAGRPVEQAGPTTPAVVTQGETYWVMWIHDQPSGADATDMGFFASSDPDFGGFTGMVLRVLTGISSDPDQELPSTAPAVTTAIESMTHWPMLTLVLGGNEGDASHFSPTETTVIGIEHVPPAVTGPDNFIDADDVALCGMIMPPWRGMRHVNTEYCAGASNTLRWRLGALTGGTYTPAGSQTVEGATTLVDNGNIAAGDVGLTEQWIPGETPSDVEVPYGQPYSVIGIHPDGAGDDAPARYHRAGDQAPQRYPIDWRSDAPADYWTAGPNYQTESVMITGSHTDSTQPISGTVTGDDLEPTLTNAPAVRGLVYVRGFQAAA